MIRHNIDRKFYLAWPRIRLEYTLTDFTELELEKVKGIKNRCC